MRERSLSRRTLSRVGKSLASVGLLAFMPTPGIAADKVDSIQTPPTVFTELIACKDIEGPTERLSCFDEKVLALGTAQATNQVVIADREQIREARRGLFGLALPKINLFGGDDDATINNIESTIVKASQIGRGKWLMTLEDGAVWVQVEARRLTRDPEPNDSIVIERAALGSFMAKIKGTRAFRVKRIVN